MNSVSKDISDIVEMEVNDDHFNISSSVLSSSSRLLRNSRREQGSEGGVVLCALSTSVMDALGGDRRLLLGCTKFDMMPTRRDERDTLKSWWKL